MQGIQNAKVAVKRACPRDGKHYFFGYYDLQAFDSTGKFHLCHQTSFRNGCQSQTTGPCWGWRI